MAGDDTQGGSAKARPKAGEMDQASLVIEQRRPPYIRAIFAGLEVVVSFLIAAFFTPEMFLQDWEPNILQVIFATLLTTPIRLWLVFYGSWTLTVAAGEIWRIRDSRPLIVIDRHGVLFHPSIHRGLISWSEITASRLTSNRTWSPYDISADYPRELQLDLRRLYWSVGSIWPRRRVSLSENVVNRPGGLTEAARLIRRYRLAAGWKR